MKHVRNQVYEMGNYFKFFILNLPWFIVDSDLPFLHALCIWCHLFSLSFVPLLPDCYLIEIVKLVFFFKSAFINI